MNSTIIEKLNSTDVGELKEVVFLGDSITVGTGIGGASYVETLRQEFGEPWNSPSIYLNNLGVTGRQARYYSENGLPSEISNPTYVIIQLGTNDLLYGDPEIFNRSYRQVIEDLIALSPHQIFSLQLPWYNLTKANRILDYLLQTEGLKFFEELGFFDVKSPVDQSVIPKYQTVIRSISQEFGIRSIDLWELTENHPEYYIDDEIHLNHFGALAVAEKINQELGSEIFA
ncbi:MAG: SGNH/GDSL hydrolase family protein [Candidatus Heimdallarchaeota archaeon]|nr:SGNH/GDSL hydrolase family protein [Candidatus Heimdallarchaeota archaeon]